MSERILSSSAALAEALHEEMARDESICIVGEDLVAHAGIFGQFKGIPENFPGRIIDTPISESAIVGVGLGSAMTGMRPIVDLHFSDFVTCCMDELVNQTAKIRYMLGGQVRIPMVIWCPDGAGIRAAAQHSQSLEAWFVHIPGLKVVAPSTPVDVVGLMAAAIRDPDPVVFLEHKALFATKGEVPDGELVDVLGRASTLRQGTDATIVALAAMVPKAIEAAEVLGHEGINTEVIDPRTLVPLDVTTIATSVAKTGRLFTVEENPRLCGWGAEVASIVADECFWDLDGPIVRITTPHIPLPAADAIEDMAIPSVDRIVETVRTSLQ